MKHVTYVTEYVLIEPDVDREVLNNPRVQASMRAAMRLASLRLSAAAWGVSEAWVQSQLSDAERAALAKTAEPVERAQLPAPKGDNA